MEKTTPCPYCENFEAAGFEVESGEFQKYNYCPVCGRPYKQIEIEIINLQKKKEDHSTNSDNH